MKKKLISVLLCGVMAVSLAACSGGGQESGNTGANGKEAEASGEEAGVNGERAGANGELEKITFALDWAPNTNHTG